MLKKFNCLGRGMSKLLAVFVTISIITTLFSNLNVRNVLAAGSINFDEYNIVSMMNSIRAVRPNCEFILVSTMLANPETLNNGNQDSYKPELQSLTGVSTAMLDMTGIHEELLKTKPYRDMNGNNINHPNDFLVAGMLKVFQVYSYLKDL